MNKICPNLCRLCDQKTPRWPYGQRGACYCCMITSGDLPVEFTSTVLFGLFLVSINV